MEQGAFVAAAESFCRTLDMVPKFLEAGPANARDQAPAILGDFYKSSRALVTDLDSRVRRMRDEIKRLSVFFGDARPCDAWEEYFALFADFARALAAAQTGLTSRRQRQAKKKTLK